VDKISDNLEAQRIVSLFKTAQVKLIKNQKLIPSQTLSPAQTLLNSKKILMIGGTSSFINHFDGNIGQNMRCFPYYKLIPLSNGCPYNCVYCYLAYVYRKYGAFIKININYSKMLDQIQKLSLQSTRKICFNLGEMLDSLALDHITNLSAMLVPFFSNLKNSYLMMLTKSCNIDNLLKLKPHNQVVVSWSLNPKTIIDKYELETASLDERINAAKKCQQHGTE
jgi:spore photoproduct lyase